jgi:hypothetical protein
VSLANLGSKSETCVGSRVHLVGASISFEKNFYQLSFTPPSLVRRIGPSGVTHEVLVPLFLVAFPLQTRIKLSDLVVFVRARVLEAWSQDLQFPMIESVSVKFL